MQYVCSLTEGSDALCICVSNQLHGAQTAVWQLPVGPHTEPVQSRPKHSILSPQIQFNIVRFEVFTAVTTKNGVFWDVTPCGSCKNRRFGGT
jgi:hypothetical protein